MHSGISGMKFKKSDILTRIKANRDEHRQIFLEAQEGYRKEVIKIFEERLAAAREKKRITHTIVLQEPMDMTKEYDRAIEMLELTTTDEIELGPEEFANFVQDDWHWQDQFLASNAVYSAAAARKLGR